MKPAARFVLLRTRQKKQRKERTSAGTIPASLLLKWKLFLNGRVLQGARRGLGNRPLPALMHDFLRGACIIVRS